MDNNDASLVYGTGNTDELLRFAPRNFHREYRQIAISGASFEFSQAIIARAQGF